MEIVAAWELIEQWLAANAPIVKKSLRPPAARSKIEKLQKKLKLKLPADFIASVQVHDGQKSDPAHGLFPAASDGTQSPSYDLLPLAAIGSTWAMMKKLHDLGEFEGRRPEAADGIQHVWWSPAWVPIADNGGGDYFCLDLAPARGGSVGQVILFGHEGTSQRRVARSFAKWMSKLARRFEAGKYVLDEDDGLVEA